MIRDPIPFEKYSGAGNDFILIDHRRPFLNGLPLDRLAATVCARKRSVGADGLILVETSDRADFKWRFFNSDGSVAEMCGNGARCVARFAFLHGIAGPDLCFETAAGMIEAQVAEEVRIKMTEPDQAELDIPLDIGRHGLVLSRINTGVPHGVVFVDDPEAMDVRGLGRAIRNHPRFAPAGTNVNFVCPGKDNQLICRTYERGVEDETLACGTGAVAAALITALKYEMGSPVQVRVRSGCRLTIHFEQTGDRFESVYLAGEARRVCQGVILPEAWG